MREQIELDSVRGVGGFGVTLEFLGNAIQKIFVSFSCLQLMDGLDINGNRAMRD